MVAGSHEEEHNIRQKRQHAQHSLSRLGWVSCSVCINVLAHPVVQSIMVCSFGVQGNGLRHLQVVVQKVCFCDLVRVNGRSAYVSNL